MKTTHTLLLIFLLSGAVLGQTKDYSSDVKSPESIVAALYEVISGEKGQARDWDRFKNLFTADAKLIPTFTNKERQVAYRAITPAEYETSFTKSIPVRGFFEREISNITEAYGNIVHVFSTYETTEEKNGKVTMRGINSIQLLKTNDRYYVVNIFWSSETPQTPLPDKYVKK
ncbi:MAG TPA: hypothetical protein VGD40_18985 [Chryseosolibacter sp.]